MDHHTQHTLSSESSRLLAPRTYRQSPVGEEFPDLAPGLVMSTFRTRQVWGGMAWRQAFPGRADKSAPARRMVGQVLADTGRRQDAEWVAAELIANAVRHTRSGQERGFFVVEVLRGADVARIVVYDLGGGSVPDFSRTPGSSPGLAEHGRGLAGVAELAVRVGVAGDAVTGHAAWAELALSGEMVQAVGACDAAGVVGRGPGPDRSPKPMPMFSGEVATSADHVDAGVGVLSVGCEGASGALRAGRVGDVPMSACRPGSHDGERAFALAPVSVPCGEGMVRQEADRVSAFGQEVWARQALAGLRRDWPDWAFLVIRFRWLAMRGSQVVIGAAGPEELRQALPPMPLRCIPATSGWALSILGERSAVEPGPPVPTLSGQLGVESHDGCAGPGRSAPPASASGVGGGAGTGLSRTVAAVPSPLGVVAAERSGTGTWAVAAAVADPVRVAWWPQGWPWGRGGGRSRTDAQAGEDDRQSDAGGIPGGGRRHRRVRAKPATVGAVVAA
ncbi:ATP-binding protein [Nonomuraea sp. NPDC050404]|uniref:ATP-binding protein n=1 Tax=Nonomuraea sp. NPDC050404 TaxID=3155783 RepID=UPI0033F296A4